MRIELFDADIVDEKSKRGAHQALADMERDWIPDEHPSPYEDNLASWLAIEGSHRRDQRWVALEDDEVLGLTHVSTRSHHADSGRIRVTVRREYRLQGVGRQLMLTAVGELESEGRSKLIVDIPIGSPPEILAERMGLKRVYSERISQVSVSKIDWGVMDSWIASSSDRASGYRLVSMRPPLPEEHIERWCRISNAMNTAPAEGFDLEDRDRTPEQWRSIETYLASRGSDLHALAAVHEQTGDFAGMTILHYLRHNPTLAYQGDTVVDPAHRYRGLGRLLKAAMAKEFLAEHPDVERITTENAGSNEPMLAINEEMGFRTILELSAWQGDIATAREAMTPRE